MWVYRNFTTVARSTTETIQNSEKLSATNSQIYTYVRTATATVYSLVYELLVRNI